MKQLQTLARATFLAALWAAACSPAADTEMVSSDAAGMTSAGDGSADDAGGHVGAATTEGGMPARAPGGLSGGMASGGTDAASVAPGEGGAPRDAGSRGDTSMSEASLDGPSADALVPGSSEAGAVDDDAGSTCALPTTFKWRGAGPLAQPKNGAVSMKDFTHTMHNGQHVVYFTTYQSSWGSGTMTFNDWPDAAGAPQAKTGFGVAPTLFYFTPKKVWVLAYQWGAHKFSYRTSSDPTDGNGWSAEKSLYNTALPAGGTGPIDQTVICDGAKCYLYYAGDNGHVYKSSMPIGSFPGEFPAAEDSGIVGTSQNLFEAVQVYKVKGSDKYLMIVEAQAGTGRYFRAWTATTLEGPWTLLTNDFAVKKNVTFSTNWTNDISHGDLVRTNPDQTFTVDPCNLELLFQGRDPSINTEYGKLPYRLGLLTLER